MDNMVSKAVCNANNKLLDERFARDKADILKHEEAIVKLTQLTTEIGQLVKQHDETIQKHETRLNTLEHKPSLWLDRILYGIIAAAIAALVAALLAGNIKF